MFQQNLRRIWAVGWLVVLAGCSLVDASGTVRRGQVAPDFALPTLEGETTRLSNFRGRPILLNFWNSWCPPCRTEMPELQRVQETLGERVVILAVNLLYQEDSLDAVRAFVREAGVSFPILLDGQGQVAGEYRVRSLPTSFFLDAEGRIYLIQVGPMTQSFIEGILQEMIR